jgi:hypothetical protein
MKVTAPKLQARMPWVYLRPWDGPNKRLLRAVPTDEDSARRSGITQAVWRHTHSVSGLAEWHPPSSEKGVEARSGILRPSAAKVVVW